MSTLRAIRLKHVYSGSIRTLIMSRGRNDRLNIAFSTHWISLRPSTISSFKLQDLDSRTWDASVLRSYHSDAETIVSIASTNNSLSLAAKTAFECSRRDSRHARFVPEQTSLWKDTSPLDTTSRTSPNLIRSEEKIRSL